MTDKLRLLLLLLTESLITIEEALSEVIVLLLLSKVSWSLTESRIVSIPEARPGAGGGESVSGWSIRQELRRQTWDLVVGVQGEIVASGEKVATLSLLPEI